MPVYSADCTCKVTNISICRVYKSNRCVLMVKMRQSLSLFPVSARLTLSPSKWLNVISATYEQVKVQYHSNKCGTSNNEETTWPPATRVWLERVHQVTKYLHKHTHAQRPHLWPMWSVWVHKVHLMREYDWESVWVREYMNQVHPHTHRQVTRWALHLDSYIEKDTE